MSTHDTIDVIGAFELLALFLLDLALIVCKLLTGLWDGRNVDNVAYI